MVARRAVAALFLLGAPACADVLNSPTIVGIASTPATSAYTSIEPDDAGTGTKATGPWRFTDLLTLDGNVEVGGTLGVTGAATFDSTILALGAITAPHFLTTDSGGMQLGGAASIGLFNDATNLSLRMPAGGGALSVQTPSAAAYAPVKALNFQSQDTGTPQFGGSAATGVFTNANDIGLRSPSGSGTFYLQSPSGGATRAQVNASGHYVMGVAPSITGTNCGFAGASMTGTDVDGTVFVGTAATNCTINFGAGFGAPPQCVVSSYNGIPFSYNRTTTTLTISQTTVGMAGTTFGWHCGGV